MHYCEIKKTDIANGPGVRVSLFVSGCRNACPDCFNKESWSFDYGQEFTTLTIDEIVECLAPDYIEGLSLLGGEPMEAENQQGLIDLAKTVKQKYPKKTIWCWTGLVWEKNLFLDTRIGNSKRVKELLSYIDVLVDGPFERDKKDINLIFRGSSNQRIIDVQKSLKKKKVVLLEGTWFHTSSHKVV